MLQVDTFKADSKISAWQYTLAIVNWTVNQVSEILNLYIA